ncbi:PREDICTED: thioredoxin domain-containing protein 3 [Gekko japonicus]|uniref:Thioredoxin domain-containing protein 3 n=1 Tax=Gekko japonicus TaxID=146911 RepID=A0ABM1KLW0_GEKJA|nr:PREDICTED: thioredoxin domain-containing protein 3 [Gekko japonicus]
MAGKKKEIQLQAMVLNQTQWDEMLLVKGLTVVDVYQAWCGPCKAVVNLFRRLKNENGEDDFLHFAVAEADSILTLAAFRDKCEPAFLFCVDGKIIDIVRGANGPLLNKKVVALIEQERKIVAGEMTRPEVQELIFLEEKESEEEAEEEGAAEEEKYNVVIIKPDAVAEGKVEEIIQTIIQAGFIVVAHDERLLDEEQVRDFYRNKSEEPEFEDFVVFMMSGPSHILIVAEGKEAPEVILHDVLENQDMLNLCDINDSLEEASRQLAFFFPDFSRKKKSAGPAVERTLALIRPALLRERRESILRRIEDDGFTIAMQKEIVLTEEQARLFYKEHENEDFFPMLLKEMTSGPTLALGLVRENAVEEWRGLLGPKVLEEAKEKCPNSLRAEFAIDSAPINQLHGSSSAEQAQKELEFFFPVEHTFAVIKPSALEVHKDEIIGQVKEAGFIISEMQETCITPEMAAQFYKAHEGQPFYQHLVDYMSKGPSMVMILTKENAVEDWRKLMGPTDPERAKQIDPNSLRARFAKDILSNAVHGSSNPDHALKSIEFVFGDIDLESLKNKYVYV